MVIRMVMGSVLAVTLSGCAATNDRSANSADAAAGTANTAPVEPPVQTESGGPSSQSPSFATPPKIEYRELNLVRSSRADAPATMSVNAEELPAEPTKILDPTMAERLFGNTGITVQWIGWEKRGPTLVAVSEEGYWMLLGGQGDTNGGNLDIEGFITEIGPDYFLYDGTIKIFGTPDKDRLCNVSKRGWRFGITQIRKYWRLREFEWCDRLTDYIDIYF